MSFEKDYPEILKYAKRKIFLQSLTTLQPEDLVNQAYLNLFDKPYSKDIFLHEISNLSLSEKHDTPIDIAWGEKGGTSGNFTGDFTCTICKEIKTASEFRIENRKFGKKVLRTECNVCENKRQLENYHKRKLHPDKSKIYAENNKRGFKKYVQNNRIKWNKYLRQRDREDRETLHDRYIKKAIRTKYKTQAKLLLESQSFIEEFRKIIMRKRLGKLNKAA